MKVNLSDDVSLFSSSTPKFKLNFLATLVDEILNASYLFSPLSPRSVILEITVLLPPYVPVFPIGVSSSMLLASVTSCTMRTFEPSVPACIGTDLLLVVPLPSCPFPLYPTVQTVPSFFTNAPKYPF